MFWGEPSSASKIGKIVHQQTLRLLLSNCYCPFLNCYCLTSPQISNYIWSYRTPIQAKLMSLERLRHEATSSMFWEEPNSASKIVKIAHQQTLRLLLSNCYCPFLNSYYLTSPQISNYIWSYRTLIQAKFMSLER